MEVRKMNTEKLIRDQMQSSRVCFSHAKKRICLVGIGPHAKRIYLPFFKKYHYELSLVIELSSCKEQTRKVLDENGFTHTNIFTIPDRYRDSYHLPKRLFYNLQAICETLSITHIIIATEPKAHFMYLEFALKNNIHVLTDKPISVCKNMTSISSIRRVRKEYYQLLDYAKESTASCKVMCQRQYHHGYEYVKKILSDVVNTYQIPITYIDIYHSDGNWEMPHDLDKENHPYKYGYGKLFHSGYHFIDLLSDILKINMNLPYSKKLKYGEVYSNCFTPQDELAVVNQSDYQRLFSLQKIPSFYQQKLPSFSKFGEKNFYGMMQFQNYHHQTITTAQLNLLHYGFSRRGWIESRNYYKENGRIRHERVNIHVGTLLNLQIHSYQSKEICDRGNLQDEEKVGGLEHFDIHIYRNTAMIGGKPFEEIKLGSLYSEKEKAGMLGYNELAREEFLKNFLNGKCPKGDLADQALAIEILYSCALGIHYHYAKNQCAVPIDMRNPMIHPVKLNELKKYSASVLKEEKNILSHHVYFKDSYEFGCFLNHVSSGGFEVYGYVSDDHTIASALFYHAFHHLFEAKIYYFFLRNLMAFKNLNLMGRLLRRRDKKIEKCTSFKPKLNKKYTKNEIDNM